MSSDTFESATRPSISIRIIRHAESYNNQVYRNARYIYRGGTPDFDSEGWGHYVDTHRKADPGLSDVGNKQAQHLAKFLVPHLTNQASRPVRFIVSPMRRALETLRPTLQQLQQEDVKTTDSSTTPDTSDKSSISKVTVHGFYFESEGCHVREVAEPGMTPAEIKQLITENQPPDVAKQLSKDIDFVGFPHPDRGWYADGQSSETRAESEERAARFYLWLMETLDQELQEPSHDVFDAGVSVPGEETENEHDKSAPRKRCRRTSVLVGHGDFMSLVLKRIVAGFGHAVETTGVPHRSAFVHYNTGITELEYFGNGRFLVMSHNATPHFAPDEYAELRSGGSLKDGWSYIMPDSVLDAEVSVAFNDELEDHVREQTEALKALYLSSRESDKLHSAEMLSVEEQNNGGGRNSKGSNIGSKKHFIVRRGMQVVGVATYSEGTGRLTDVAVRPSASKEVSETLFNAVKDYSRRLGRSGSLLIEPRTNQTKTLFESMGFKEIKENDEERSMQMELKH